jgi:hypothetical protein
VIVACTAGAPMSAMAITIANKRLNSLTRIRRNLG